MFFIDQFDFYKQVLSTCGDQNQYLSPDDAISLSLEYYQSHLDTTDETKPSDTKSTNFQDTLETKSDEKPSDLNNSANLSADKTQNCDNNSNNIDNASVNSENNDQTKNENGEEDKHNKFKSENANGSLDTKRGDRRYLQCPAAVTMSLLQKFLRMKYALSAEHRVSWGLFILLGIINGRDIHLVIVITFTVLINVSCLAVGNLHLRASIILYKFYWSLVV